MADVPKGLYRRYLEVSEATFQALLKNHAAGEIHHYKPILYFSSPHKGFEGCLPCLFVILGLLSLNAIRPTPYERCVMVNSAG